MQHVGLHMSKPRVQPLPSPRDSDFASVSACAIVLRQDLKGFACWESSSCSLPCSCQALGPPQRSEGRRDSVLLPGSPSTWVRSYARHSFRLLLQPSEAWGRAQHFKATSRGNPGVTEHGLSLLAMEQDSG